MRNIWWVCVLVLVLPLWRTRPSHPCIPLLWWWTWTKWREMSRRWLNDMRSWVSNFGLTWRPTKPCKNTHTHGYINTVIILCDGPLFVCFSSECADIMTGGTRRCIVVSTLAEASFYADHGFDDILYAYPLPFDKVPWTHTPKRLILYVINSSWGYVYESKYQSRWIFRLFLLT